MWGGERGDQFSKVDCVCACVFGGGVTTIMLQCRGVGDGGGRPPPPSYSIEAVAELESSAFSMKPIKSKARLHNYHLLKDLVIVGLKNAEK